MTFQSLLMETGMTGWMLAVYFIASAGPMPKSQLFWIGTLIRSATGFWSFWARSAFLVRRVSGGGAEHANQHGGGDVIFVGRFSFFRSVARLLHPLAADGGEFNSLTFNCTLP